MCFSAQTLRLPDRKSPCGHTTAVLPKSYVTHSYKLKQLPPPNTLPWGNILALICQVHFLLRFLLACGIFLWMLCPCVFESVHLGLYFISQQDFYSVTWFPQFIHYQWYLYFRPTGMSPNVRDASLRARGLWLVILQMGPLLHTPCLPSSSPCMARLDDSLPPDSSHKIPTSTAEQRPRRRSGKKVKTNCVHSQTNCHCTSVHHTPVKRFFFIISTSPDRQNQSHRKERQ